MESREQHVRAHFGNVVVKINRYYSNKPLFEWNKGTVVCYWLWSFVVQ